MSSDQKPISESPWRIDKPGPKPPPGPERSAWLDRNVVVQNRESLYQLLGAIDPKLRLNERADLEPQSVALKVLEYLEELSKSTSRGPTILAITQYLNRGFKVYCKFHSLRRVSLPILSELGVEDGILESDSISRIELHAKLTPLLVQWIKRLHAEKSTPRSAHVAGVLIGAAALFGGFSERRQWVSLANQLKSLPNTDGTHIWYRLQGKNAACHYLLEPVVEALVRIFTDRGWLPIAADYAPSARLHDELSPLIALATQTRLEHSSKGAAFMLRYAAMGYQERFFPADVISILREELENSPLSDHALARFLRAGTTVPSPQIQAISARRNISKPRVATSNAELANSLQKIERAIHWNPEEARKDGLKENAVPTTGRDEYVDNLTDNLANIRNGLLRSYQANGRDASTCYPVILTKFIEDLVNHGGPVVQNLAPATIAAYSAAVLKHCSEFIKMNLVSTPASIREEAYRNILTAQSGRLRSTLNTALPLFERSLTAHYDDVDEVDWSVLPVVGRFAQNPDSNWVDPYTYERLLDCLSQATYEDEPLRDIHLTISVALYRGGLRRYEAHELTLAGLLVNDDRTVLIRVAPSRLTVDKTRQSIRDIGPIELSEREWAILSRYVNRRKVEMIGRQELRDVYLFAPPGVGSALYDGSVLFDPIVGIMRQIASDPSLKIRHFRHGFATRLMATGRCEFNDLDESAIRTNRWRRDFDADGAWVRAFEMGHISPFESIRTYGHATAFVQRFISSLAIVRLLTPVDLALIASMNPRSIERALLRGDQESASDTALATFLESVRRRFPIRPSSLGSPETPTNVSGDEHPFLEPIPAVIAPPRYFKQIEFADVLQLSNDRIKNQLDISRWETRKFSPSEIRQIIERVDWAISMGLLPAKRTRKMELDADLSAIGEKLRVSSRTLLPTQLRDFMAKLLIGVCRTSGAVLVDAGTADLLALTLTKSGADPALLQADPHRGLVQVCLNRREGNPHPMLQQRLFFVLLGILFLDKSELETQVRPYVVPPQSRIRSTMNAA